MKKRSIITTTMIAFAIMLGIIAAPAAGAATTAAATLCTVKANLPAKIAITKHYTSVPVRLTGCAGRVNWAGTDVYSDAHGLLDVLMWDGSPDTDYLAIYDWEPVGTYYTTDGSGSSSPDYDDLNWTRSTTVIKYGSAVSATPKRINGITSVAVKAKSWNPDYNIWGGWKPWASKLVSVYVKNTASSAWRKAGTVRTNSAGTATLKIRTAGARYWQARTADGGTTFGATSAVRTG